MELLSVKNLSKSYGSKKVLDNVSFSVSSGKIVGLFKSNIVLDNSSIKLVMFMGIFFYIFVIFFINVLSLITFNKGVNVE